MSVDVSEIRKGRIAVFELEITDDGVDFDDEVCVAHGDGGLALICARDIVAVKDKPYTPAVGDVVTWGSGFYDYTVIAKYGDDFWLRATKTGDNIVRNIDDISGFRRVS